MPKTKTPRATFKTQFQNLAADFKALAAASVRDTMAIIHGSLAEAKAGQSITKAFRAEMLNLLGLREIVVWHTAADIPNPQLGLVDWHRGPIGLFNDIVNGPTPAYFKGERAPTPAPGNGLLANLGYLPETTPTGAMRAARACEILATLVGSKPAAPKKRSPSKSPKALTDKQNRVLELRDKKRLSFEEIGKRLGTNKSAAKELHGRAKLRESEIMAHVGSVKAQALPLGDAAPRGKGGRRSGSAVRESL